MSTKMTLEWKLRELMATKGLFQTTDLLEPLKQCGVSLSREQVYRLVAKTPQRINVEVLAALCDILGCTAADLLVLRAQVQPGVRTGTEDSPGIRDLRPIRARVRRPSE